MLKNKTDNRQVTIIFKIWLFNHTLCGTEIIFFTKKDPLNHGKKKQKKRKKRPTRGHNRLNNGPCIGGCWVLQLNIYRDWVVNHHPPTHLHTSPSKPAKFFYCFKNYKNGGLLKTNGAFTLDVKSVWNENLVGILGGTQC